MKEKFKRASMQTAQTFAELSSARRLKVGAIIVKEDRIISIGYNGMPAGWDNNCEDREYMSIDAGGWINPDDIVQLWPFESTVEQYGTNIGRYRLKTKPEVLHAETNAVAKLAKSTESVAGAMLFVTHAPCLDCAKLIYQSGIKRVWFSEAYRNTDGVEFLKKSGVEVEQYNK